MVETEQDGKVRQASSILMFNTKYIINSINFNTCEKHNYQHSSYIKTVCQDYNQHYQNTVPVPLNLI